MKKDLKIGLFGFGVVGQGLYDVLRESRGIKAEIRRIAVKNHDKPRPLPADMFVYDPATLLEDPDLNLIVELINDPQAAHQIVTAALRHGKDVVTANKKMVAEHLSELVALQRAHGGSLLYEASACGSIPIVRTLEEYYDNELLLAVSGIFNGSSNFILTKVCSQGVPYAAALAEAQALGFAETDPTLDVGGFDALYKLIILTAHAYGLYLRPDEVFCYGIQHLTAADIRYAREKDLKIKLVCTVRRLDATHLTLFVMPQLVRREELLFNVDHEYNGVVVEAAFSEKQFFMGKGAGGHPTGSAVLSDISATTYDYRYEYKKTAQHQGTLRYTRQVDMEVYLSYRHEADLEGLPLRVLERYQGRDAHYVVARLTLDDLFAHRAQLEEKGVFVALHTSALALTPPA